LIPWSAARPQGRYGKEEQLGKIPREWVERAARVYSRNTDAAESLGITARSFSRVCRRHGIDTPYVRQQKERAVLRVKHT